MIDNHNARNKLERLRNAEPDTLTSLVQRFTNEDDHLTPTHPVASRTAQRDQRAAEPAIDDDYWRSYYHPRPEILKADERGTTYRVNKNAIAWHVNVHYDLVDLFQFFFDIKTLLDKSKLSTTGYMNILNQLHSAQHGCVCLSVTIFHFSDLA